MMTTVRIWRFGTKGTYTEFQIRSARDVCKEIELFLRSVHWDSLHFSFNFSAGVDGHTRSADIVIIRNYLGDLFRELRNECKIKDIKEPTQK
jgi:hypothetical protein